MNISSDTLFHFTKNIKYLSSILRNGIYIRYSLETYGDILESKSELVLPMSCFCDIPLSQTNEHRKKYGTYAIGLSKEWGLKNGLSPVLYAHSNSETAKILNSLSSDLQSIFDIEESEENKLLLEEYGVSPEELDWYESGKRMASRELNSRNLELSKKLSHFLKYIKPYYGKGYTDGHEFGKIKFYNEREWRYVPPKNLLQKIEIKDIYKREFYSDPIKRRHINIKLAKHKKLTFDPKDIKFIIVERDHEIPDMIETLRSIYGEKCSHNELLILYSNLISFDRIKEDL